VVSRKDEAWYGHVIKRVEKHETMGDDRELGRMERRKSTLENMDRVREIGYERDGCE
jgi:hypothetical protein